MCICFLPSSTLIMTCEQKEVCRTIFGLVCWLACGAFTVIAGSPKLAGPSFAFDNKIVYFLCVCPICRHNSLIIWYACMLSLSLHLTYTSTTTWNMYRLNWSAALLRGKWDMFETHSHTHTWLYDDVRTTYNNQICLGERASFDGKSMSAATICSKQQ